MSDTAQIDAVTAPLNFVVRGSTPVSVPNEPGVLKLHHYEGRHEAHPVRIENARPRLGEISLDREGFAIVRHRTAVDFYDEEQRTTVYEREIEDLLKKELGAKKVIVFDHTLRAGDDETRVKRVVREPVQMVHNDYTARSGPQRLRDHVGDEAAGDLLKGRMAIVNVWRGNRKPVKSMPLAVADARTIDGADLVSTERRAKDRIGEIQHMVYNPDTRWYYVPDMEPDEAMLIKCYDSDESVARFAAHSAFADPNTPADAPFRESIESRTFVFF